MRKPTASWLRHLTARSVLVALAPLALDGCLSIGVDRLPAQTPAPDARCRLEARLYEKGKDVKRDVKSTREVTWKLFRRDGSPAAPVTEGTGAAWSVTDLAPGSYRIAAAWGPKPGAPDDKSGGSGEETFTLHAGDTARADFVLSKFPTWAWIVLGVVVVGIIVGAIAMVSFAHALEGVSLFGSNAVPDGAPERSPSVEEPAAELPAE